MDFWVLSDEGTVALLYAVPLISPVLVKVGVTSKSIFCGGFRTTEQIEPAIGECERSKELGLGEEHFSSSISVVQLHKG